MAVIPGLDERYIAGTDLSPYFVDKDTGAPLAGGTVEFWRDVQRATPKLVYTLQGPNNLGAYEYVPLDNPITLSGVGTIEDAIGNNVPLYYFPYDVDGNLDLYYIVVKSALGVPQFTRQAWPTLAGSEDPTTDNGIQTNQISNPQFAQFNYDNTNSVTLTFTGASSGFAEIAPDWILVYSHAGSGTILVERIAVAGSANYPTNPPFLLRVTPGVNVTLLQLRQRLNINPAIWATTTDGIVGYVSAGILLGSNTAVTINYVPSSGAPASISLLNANNVAAAPAYYTGGAEIPLSTSGNTGLNGNINITINLSIVNVSEFSSVQVVGTGAGQVVPYVQETVNRQIDHLFHYYSPKLLARSQKSLLTGWDFPYNPAQFSGRTQAASGLAFQSRYVWDQTILYQSAAAAFQVAGSVAGELIVENVSGANAQFALVQYLGQRQARAALAGTLSVAIDAYASSNPGVQLTVSLWYTTDANLPVIAADGVGVSIVNTLSSTGFPSARNGNWTEIAPKDNGPMTTLFSVDSKGGNISFNYWVPGLTATASETATYFAIVVGSAPVSNGTQLIFSSISLCPSTTASAPAPQTRDEVLRECQYYWQKSYPVDIYPGTASYEGQREFSAQVTGIIATMGPEFLSVSALSESFSANFASVMRKAPTLKLYSPITGTLDNLEVIASYFVAGAPNLQGGYWILSAPVTGFWTTASTAFPVAPAPRTFTSAGYVNTDGFFMFNNRPKYYQAFVVEVAGGTTINDCVFTASFIYHYVADARLGIV